MTGLHSDARRVFGTPFRSIALCACFIAPATEAWGQGVIVHGIVRSRSGAAIEGARVLAIISGHQTTTLADGAFRITLGTDVVDTVRVERVGFASRSITVRRDSAVRLEVELVPVAVPLDEILITATAGTQNRRAQGATIATVPVADLMERVPMATVVEALQGRVTGLDLTPSSGSSGQAQRLWLRGGTSIALSNEPLVFVDGVRADSRIHRMNFNVGGQASSRLFDIDPGDIERVEIVKGPAASTIYGADAAAGIVQIFTKGGAIGSRQFAQRVVLESSVLDPIWSAPPNFARCDSADVLPGSAVTLCRNGAAGTVIVDNPLERSGVLRTGHGRGARWSVRGGGENFSVYSAIGGSSESGTLSQSAFDRRNSRIKSRLAVAQTLSVDVSFGVAGTHTAIPPNGDNPDGLLAAGLIGNPRTVGGRSDGAFGTPIAALASIEQTQRILRITPTVQMSHTIGTRVHHRVIAGADMTYGRGRFFVPVRVDSAFVGSLAGGVVSEEQTAHELRTVDYVVTARMSERAGPGLSLLTSFGTQYVESRDEKIVASGFGLVSNFANRVSDAAQRTGTQSMLRTRSHGAFAHAEVGFRERAFLQVAARADRHSAFGSRAGVQFFPKIGISVVVHETDRYASEPSWLETFRLRTAYGTSGRSPAQGDAGATYRAAPVLAGPEVVIQGLAPASPGNARLRPERGAELEVGADAAFFRDRLGLEATYFEKRTRDLLFRIPRPPSSGFPEEPLGNLGGIRNRGLEMSVGLSTQLFERALNAELNLTLLSNELTDLGEVQPFSAWTVARFEEGRPLGAAFDYRVLSLDVAAQRAIVTEVPEYVGSSMPTRLAALGVSMDIIPALHAYVDIDGKGGFYMHNLDADARDRYVRNSERSVRAEALRDEDRLRRFGPFFTKSGRAVSDVAVRGPYLQDASFVRWRSASITWDLPRRWLSPLRSRSASLTVAGHNIHLWTRYEGDPEVVSYVSETTRGGATQYGQPSVFTMPQSRRWSTRVNLWF